MKVGVIGGGNIGTWTAAACAKAGHEVVLYCSRPEAFDRQLRVVGDTNELSYGATLSSVTNRLSELKSCHILLVTYPTELFSKLSEELLPYLSPSVTALGFLPGATAELAFKQYIERGFSVFGLQRVPGVARVIDYGKSVRASGIRAKLHVACIGRERAAEFAAFFAQIFAVPCAILPNYLPVTLVPSNSVLHTGRLYAMFGQGTKIYGHNLLFYEEWDDASSEAVFAMDAELQELCKKLPFDVSGIVSLHGHYESETAHDLTNKIRSISSFRGLTSPMKQEGAGFVADFQSRYFSSDFPYGLATIQEFARLLRVDTPAIDKVMAWYKDNVPAQKTLRLCDCGITSEAELIDFYRK